MRIKNEDKLLDQDFRKKVIDEILGNANQERKAEMKKRYEIFKDNTKPYVLEMLNAESSEKQAMEEALNRAANVSFTRDIIEKKAMVYKDGVVRTSTNQEQVDTIADLLDVNSKMKKVNKYAELFKNALVTILPYENPSEPGKYRLMMNCYAPYLYDVVEDATNPEVARAYVFSTYDPSNITKHKDVNEAGNREAQTQGTASTQSPNEYIWWSHKYHFTTNEKGEIIQGRQENDYLNPIGFMPCYNFSQDQDGCFWAKGGNDIVEAGLLLNLLLTDLFYIAKYQGMGIGYMFGKGVPKNMKVGASSFISVEMEEGDPTPQLGFATSNPPIEAHLRMIKDYLTYILHTNNLAPDTGDATMTSSGIHEMIRKSQNSSDIEDQRELYRDGEPILFKIIFKWLNLYNELNALDEEFSQLAPITEDTDVTVKFEDAQPFMTEMDKLNAIEKRLDLGIYNLIDAIKRDNPDLTEEEAMEKARKIKEEKLQESRERVKQFGKQDNVQAEAEGSDNEGFDNGAEE